MLVIEQVCHRADHWDAKAALALKVAADQVMCSLNEATSIPAGDMTARIYLEKVLLEIALCGLAKPIHC